jgi:hypothetical protein
MSSKRKSNGLGSYRRRVAGEQRRLRELQDQKREEAPGPAKKSTRSNPYLRMLKKLDSDNKRRGPIARQD